MIRRLRDLRPGELEGREWPLVIAGAGMAGITLAASLPEDLPVLLLEGGGEHYDPRSQDVYAGRIDGHPYFPLVQTRLRFLGGSSNHWAGWCRPLDAEDFDAPPSGELPGWPFGIQELEPWAEKASEILELPALAETPPAARAWEELFAGLPSFGNAPFRFSPPTRFAARFADLLRDRSALQVLLGANLVGLDFERSRVSHLRVRAFGQAPRKLKARALVLAMGGIENPRFLLNQSLPAGGAPGDQGGLLGACFSEHPHFVLGAFVLEDHALRALRQARQALDPLACHRYLAPLPGEARQAGAIGLRFEAWDPANSDTFRGRLKRLLCARDWSRDLVENLRGEALHCGDGVLKGAAEQPQRPQSRVRLGSEVDELGLRRPTLDWKLQREDKDLLRRQALRMGQELALCGIARLRLPEWLLEEDDHFPLFPQEELAGHHHMGTTRISQDPMVGVCDPQGRVHGLDNLFVAGSSLFPRCGYANPSFTIVQLALRQAQFLRPCLL